TGNVAMARAAYLIAKDPGNSNRRLFVNVKMNLAAKPTGLAFTLAPASVLNPAGGSVPALRIAWETTAVTTTAEEILRPARPASPRNEAAALIAELLRDGPVLATKMEQELREAGVSEGT